MPSPDFSPSAEQNKRPILDKLLTLLPAQGAALEIASGTGQHAAWFAQHLPGWRWQPTDLQSNGFDSIQSHATQAGVANVLAALPLDVCAESWLPTDPATTEAKVFDLIFCANMLHIAPWAACVGLMRGAARQLAPQGQLITYGPYFEKNVPTVQSNLDFDASLRQRHPAWGVRWLDAVAQEAALVNLQLRQRHTMPANNLLLVWQRVPG